MAYRRKQGITRAATFKEEIQHRRSRNNEDDDAKAELSPPSLAAQAIRASAAHRDSSLSNAYGDSAFYRDSSLSSSFNNPPTRSSSSKGFNLHETTSVSNESNSGFWGVLARKAKAIIDDDNGTSNSNTSGSTRFQMWESGSQPSDSIRRLESPRFRKGLDAITTSLNQIGDTFEKAFEEGKTIMENKTADIIQETRKFQIRRKSGNSETHNQISGGHSTWQTLPPTQLSIQTAQETQLKASRDVAMATAAKAKLLLRELKTTKADFAFAKQRCSQLEEENKMLRDSRTKSDNPADDDMIRLQLETLLAEKARLAHENSVYARENRFLREIVEYHQLTMQDVVYIDEGIEEVTEVYQIPTVTRMLSPSPPISPHFPPSVSLDAISPTVANHVSETNPRSSDPLGEDKYITNKHEGARNIDSIVLVDIESERGSASTCCGYLKVITDSKKIQHCMLFNVNNLNIWIKKKIQTSAPNDDPPP